MGNIIKRYFDWLQQDVPAGEIEKYPEISENGETSVKGMYVIGDLTGIPLLKPAAESGAKMISFLNDEPAFQKDRENKETGVLDFVIVGAGPSGIAAGLEAKQAGYDFKIVDSSCAFSTIINFPKGKPIYAEPEDMEQVSQLSIREGVKESLLEDLAGQLKGKNLPIDRKVNVENIVKKNGYFEILMKEGTYRALRVLLAIGKSGNSRLLKVPGEDLDKVYNRLIDPADAEGLDVLVVGGGDSAMETAVAVAEYAKSVTLSYRKAEFSRPKEWNIEAVRRLEKEGKLTLEMESEVKGITETGVVLMNKEKKEVNIANTMVFVLIGKELPLDFFKKIRVKVEGVLSGVDKLMFAALLLFSGVVYFGKAGLSSIVSSVPAGQVTWGDVLNQVLSFEFWKRFFTYPLTEGFFKEAHRWNWTDALSGVLGYVSFLGFVVIGLYLLVYFFRNIKNYTASVWKTFKYSYFIVSAVFFCFVYLGSKYFGLNFMGKSPYFWYTFLYSLTILIFGFRRMVVKPTGYIKRQTWVLILIQVIPLFLLPEIILPMLGKAGLLGGKEGFLLTQVFPGGDFGHAYRLILAWPLNIYGLFADAITVFWFIYTIVFTFGFIYYIVFRWGKGAYCGWICSCGALAETLGDEYRTLAPHGVKAKRWENVGQWVLGAAFIITFLKLAAVLGGINIPIIHTPRPLLLDVSRMVYTVVVDIVFAGVLGVGVYFFLSGRIWCRYFCPLAALMHIFTRFSRYRIFADKKKCISCNICTKVCHMGIDVMSYANKGVPMNDVECVRCSACVVQCPMEVLYFGSLSKGDVSNKLYKTEGIPERDKSSWTSGL